MADARFFDRKGPFTLGELAAIGGARLADAALASREVRDVAPLDQAGEHDISFLDNVKYAAAFEATKAGACVARPDMATRAPQGLALLVSDDPYRAYARIAHAFYPEPDVPPGISPQAIVDPAAHVDPTARIDAFAVVEAGARIGPRVWIRSGTFIGSGVEIGEESRIGPQATVQYALVGKRAMVHSGVRIGQDGFGFAMGREGHLKVPQLGRVVIGDDVEIGANSCIDRGAGPDTVIGHGTKIDNLVQIGHNVTVGRLAVIVSQVGISGSTKVGDGAVLAGQVGVAGHLTIGPGARVAAQSGVTRDVPAGQSYGGYPAVPVRDWHRQAVTLAKLIRPAKE